MGVFVAEAAQVAPNQKKLCDLLSFFPLAYLTPLHLTSQRQVIKPH